MCEASAAVQNPLDDFQETPGEVGVGGTVVGDRDANGVGAAFTSRFAAPNEDIVPPSVYSFPEVLKCPMGSPFVVR